MRLPPESVKLGGLRYLATMYAESVTPESEIRKEDVLPLLREDLVSRLQKRHLINMQILGQVTEGKSTVMLQFLLFILEHMHKKLTIANIAGDQVEGLRKIADPANSETCIGIDEWNALATTGLNATTESAQYQYYSDVQAQRYIHKLACSPGTVVDPNADIALQVVSVDKAAERTYFTVHVKLSRPNGESFFQLVGLASVCVHQALHHPVYAEYRRKKFKKMALVTKEGVRDVRELEMARIIVEVFNRLQGLAAHAIVSRDTCSVYVDVVRHEHRELLSILSSDDIVRKVHGLLRAKREIYELSQRLSKPRRGASEDDATGVKADLERMSKTLSEGLAYYKHMINVYEEYKRI